MAGGRTTNRIWAAVLCAACLLLRGASVESFSIVEQISSGEELLRPVPEPPSGVEPDFSDPEQDAGSDDEEVSEDIPEPSEPEASRPETAEPLPMDLSENAEEEEDPDQEEAAELDLVEINNSTVIVSSFTELKQALSNDNGYVNIFLAEDLEIEGGITIHSNKKSVVIDGINPQNPGIVHKVYDRYSNLGGVVAVRSNSGTKDLSIRNMELYGLSFYGPFAAEDHVYDLVISYHNVTYEGPQLTYNRNGMVRYTGDVDINIIARAGSHPVNEAAECRWVVFDGNVNITHTSTTHSCYLILGAGGSISVLPGANVTMEITGREVFRSEGGQVAVSVGQGASLVISSKFGMAIGGTSRVSDMDIGENAYFSMTKTADEGSQPAVNITGQLTIDEGARFHVFVPFATKDNVLGFTMNGSGITANDPDSVILYTAGNAPALRYTVDGHVTIETRNLSYWRTAASLDIAGTLEDPPLYRWQRDSQMPLLSVKGTSNASTQLTALESNYTEEDGPDPLNMSTFTLPDLRVFAFGRLPLVLGGIIEGTDDIIGSTKSTAALQVQYPLADGIRTLEGRASASGLFEIPVTDYLEPGLEVTATANRDFLTRVERMTVTAHDNYLVFLSLPEELHFRSVRLTPDLALVPRAGDFSILVGDRRKNGGPWGLRVKVLQPMTAGPGVALENSLLFVDEQYGRHTLNEASLPIAQGTTSQPGEIAIVWREDQGILLQVNPDAIMPGIVYEGLLGWTLTNAP